MKISILGGVACAALIGLAQPAIAAAASPAFPASATFADGAPTAHADGAIWLENGQANAAARQFIDILDRASLDGLASGPALASRARSLLDRADNRDPAAAAEADRLLSSALVTYVQAIQTPPPGVTYGDSWVVPRQSTPAQILAAAAKAPADYVAQVSAVNPVYAKLRDAAYAEMQLTGAPADDRVVASLARVREAPFQKRYIIVDAASATLWMIEDGSIAGQMKVIVGKAEAPTPMIASTIYRATLNPYWNVPGDLVKSLIAPRVAAQGVSYLTERNYDVLSGYGDDATPVDPASVDWAAVAEGSTIVKLRRGPGPANSMGKMKFGFPNANDIFLHDTPNKELFASEDRDLSHGCIRLSDAPRLARFLLGRDASEVTSDIPEQQVLLPTPVPIYVTYLTAQAKDGRVAFVDDIYGKDRAITSEVASLR
ncbi:MAG: L,D-transpeptidase family protein [Sphingomicrobium sp.]